ncbi:UDP-N-acetylglucosamine 1-carboxyvinyltransferase [Clostridium sp. C2-6-12]|uniref:UDP-N-acetylglucosamine 1-carboxyvinyltransferase n=1 Tax=Clostridium sp. C2-6-12 TaxID=2698832 RepID=UPI001367B5A5|nr:UDP-N-acetylglucosamine 1-carboxyvinyltransferase [Clostridium sp. C2-6-12]
MKQYIIKGGKALQGEVKISGSKNAALPILAGAIMADETVTISNVPDVNDVAALLKAIEELGAIVERIDANTVKINGSTINTYQVDNEEIHKIRSSYYLVGALIAKQKRAKVPLPGGCNIGTRAIDYHIKGFELLGIDTKIEYGFIDAKADKLVGNYIYFDGISVGATINIMLAATMAEGQTVLENAAKEPHVVDVANFLNSLGADIKGAGTDTIRIKGVERLHGSEYCVIPDQIEAGTFMIAAAATKGDVLVTNVIPKHLEAISAKLIEIGVEVQEFDNAISVSARGKLRNSHVKTLPYPGFPTDLQPQITTLLAISSGASTVDETIFESRFGYVKDLIRMGANIRVENGTIAMIEGVSTLMGTKVCALDLRGGVAMIIAGLVADGYTKIEQIEYIERGYEGIIDKLSSLGADIDIIPVNDERAVQKFKLKIG